MMALRSPAADRTALTFWGDGQKRIAVIHAQDTPDCLLLLTVASTPVHQQKINTSLPWASMVNKEAVLSSCRRVQQHRTVPLSI